MPHPGKIAGCSDKKNQGSHRVVLGGRRWQFDSKRVYRNSKDCLEQMTRHPRITGRQLIRVQAGEIIGPGLLMKIIRDCEVEIEDLGG